MRRLIQFRRPPGWLVIHSGDEIWRRTQSVMSLPRNVDTTTSCGAAPALQLLLESLTILDRPIGPHAGVDDLVSALGSIEDSGERVFIIDALAERKRIADQEEPGCVRVFRRRLLGRRAVPKIVGAD